MRDSLVVVGTVAGRDGGMGYESVNEMQICFSFADDLFTRRVLTLVVELAGCCGWVTGGVGTRS